MEEKNLDTDTAMSFSNQLADAVEKIGPALVLVNGRQRMPGSGVVFAKGLVLTADHVLEREDDLTIKAADGSTFKAEFAGRDPATDLAVLRVAGLEVEPATLAEDARVGQLVLAVGRPSGSGPMASVGIVSAVGGPIRTARGAMLDRVIQTDATPYPGFSGGPMIDARGRVLGILTTGLARGIPLGVPADIAWRIADTLATTGSIKRGFLGISSQPVRLPEGQRAGRTQESGLMIVRVEPDTPAQAAGLMLGDVVVGFDGTAIADTDDLQGMLSGERVGRTVPVEVIRGGKLETLQVKVGERG